MYIPDELYKKIKLSLPIACVDILLLHEDKFLLVRRNQEPLKGSWWFPGGRIYKSELIFDAAVRKGKEELRLDLQVVRIASIEESIFNKENGMDLHTINIVVEMQLVNFKQSIVLDSTHSEFAWRDSIEDWFHPCIRKPLVKANFPFAKRVPPA
jgi:colanic acid biosynthesis protein WcaH